MTWNVGQSVIWRYTPRGGYGYIYRVPALVVKCGPKRVQIEVTTERGEIKRVWVSPHNLDDVTRTWEA